MEAKNYLAPPEAEADASGVSIGAYEIKVVNGVADVSHVDHATRQVLVGMGWRPVADPKDGAARPLPPASLTQSLTGGAAIMSGATPETINALQILQEVERLSDTQLQDELRASGAAFADGSDREALIRALHTVRLDAHRAANTASAGATGAVPDGATGPTGSDAPQSDGTIAQTDAEKAAADAAASGATGPTGATGNADGSGGESEAVSPRRKRGSDATHKQ